MSSVSKSSVSLTLTAIRQIIADTLCIELHSVSLLDPFKDLGCDSLDLVKIIHATEDEFAIEISDDAAIKILTVADLHSAVQHARSLKAMA